MMVWGFRKHFLFEISTSDFMALVFSPGSEFRNIKIISLIIVGKRGFEARTFVHVDLRHTLTVAVHLFVLAGKPASEILKGAFFCWWGEPLFPLRSP